MKNLVSALLLLLVVGLVGCVPQAARMVHIVSPFDADKARELSQGKGNNTIKGSALMRQAGGGVVTCAGQKINLIPATEFASERMQAIYGNVHRGVVPLHLMRIEYSPVAPSEYFTLKKTKVCDAQGFFKFEEVPDGEYFLTTMITWIAGQDNYQGGGLMQRVDANGGNTVEVVLAP